MDNTRDFIEELESRSQIIPNIDLDGILSGALVSKYYPHLKVVGYTDSNTNIWLDKTAQKDKLIYLDFYSKKEGICCIDQHILDINDVKYEPLKFNPNRQLKKTNKTYTSKYPLSTFIYILWILEINGVRVDLNIDATIDENVTLIDLILRADGILLNRALYQKNMTTWINFLSQKLSNDSVLLKIFQKLEENTSEQYAREFQSNIETKLKNKYSGYYKDGFDFLSKGFFDLMTRIYNVLDININFTRDISTYTDYKLLRPQFTTSNTDILEQLINDNRTLTYAIPKRNYLSIQIHEKDYGMMNDYNHVCVGYFKNNKFIKK